MFSAEQALVGRDEKRAPLRERLGCCKFDFRLDKISRESRHTQKSYDTCCKTSLPWPVKRTTCTDFVTKSSTSLYFLQQPSTTFQDRFDAWVVKRATPLLNSFCSNIAKQVTCFFCLFYRTFRGGFIEVLPSL